MTVHVEMYMILGLGAGVLFLTPKIIHGKIITTMQFLKP